MTLRIALYIIYGLGVLITTGKICAQDTIVFVNGTKHPAKIIEISEKKVKYKNPKDTLGPTYVISRKDVERFIRQDGCFEIEDKGYENCVKDPNYYVIKNENFTRRILYFDFARFFALRAKFGFDYVTPNRKLGFGAYYEHSMNDLDDKDMYVREVNKKGTINYVSRNKFNGGFFKVNNFGVELKLYPYAHKKIVYWLGFIVEAGQCGNMVIEEKHIAGVNVTHIYTSNYAVVATGNSYYTNTGNIYYYKELYAGGYFSNGFIYRPRKHIAIQGYFSFGINSIQLKEEHNRMNTVFAIVSGLKLGYAF